VTTLPPATLDGVLETALYVDDLPRARAFYVDVLGCTAMLDSSRLVALDVAGRSVLLLFQRGATDAPLPTPGGLVPGHGGAGAQHLAFAVAADALPAWDCAPRRRRRGGREPGAVGAGGRESLRP
jgi:catechol 2,3-dioxygenase-like lactoylglutathione lyase family enzyme